MKKKLFEKRIIKGMILSVFVIVLISVSFQACQKEEMIEPESVMLKSATTIDPLTFFTSPEEFPCPDLPTEDFEKAVNSLPSEMENPLDEYTNNDIFSTGDILPGVSILTSDNSIYPDIMPLMIWPGGIQSGISSYAVFANRQDEKLIIEFTDDNVTDVSMTLYEISSTLRTYTIEIYGNEEALLGNKDVEGVNKEGQYFGVHSPVPIKKITVYCYDSKGNGVEGVDDLSFGSCISDTDGDGCPDSEDEVINSNMEEFVNIDGCSNGVPNKMTSECGEMMSDMIDDLENGSYKNTGQFVKSVTQLAKTWMDEGLISQEEQTLLLACAGQSSIGSKK